MTSAERAEVRRVHRAHANLFVGTFDADFDWAPDAVLLVDRASHRAIASLERAAERRARKASP